MEDDKGGNLCVVQIGRTRMHSCATTICKYPGEEHNTPFVWMLIEVTRPTIAFHAVKRTSHKLDIRDLQHSVTMYGLKGGAVPVPSWFLIF